MRQFNITVNGIGYQVSVEEVAAGAAGAAAPVAVSAPVAAPAPVAAAPAPVAAPAPAAAVTDGVKISSPMPGTILDVKCKAGDAVKKRDDLLILEAMKMENEIVAPADGTVKQVAVAKGASVNSGDVMVVIG
jgi:glutaconyl-CoA decarboxylase